jgi:hypothetical protein
VTPIVLLLAARLLADVDQSASQSQDIVIAHNLRRWRAGLVIGENDTLGCHVARPSGDAVDATGCAATQQCFVAEQPHIQAARRPGLTAAARRHLLEQVRRDLDGCFKATSYRFATSPGGAPSPAAATPSDANDPAR